jgi:hypothetical protein
MSATAVIVNMRIVLPFSKSRSKRRRLDFTAAQFPLLNSLRGSGILLAGSLKLLPGPGALSPASDPVTADSIADSLQGYVIPWMYLLVALLALFAAGLPTPLDRRRLLGSPESSYTRGEASGLLGFRRSAICDLAAISGLRGG